MSEATVTAPSVATGPREFHAQTHLGGNCTGLVARLVSLTDKATDAAEVVRLIREGKTDLNHIGARTGTVHRLEPNGRHTVVATWTTDAMISPQASDFELFAVNEADEAVPL